MTNLRSVIWMSTGTRWLSMNPSTVFGNGSSRAGFTAASSSVEMFEDLFEKFDLTEVECVVGWLVLGSTRRTRSRCGSSLFENVAEDRALKVCLKSASVDVEWTIAEQNSHCPRSGGVDVKTRHVFLFCRSPHDACALVKDGEHALLTLSHLAQENNLFTFLIFYQRTPQYACSTSPSIADPAHAHVYNQVNQEQNVRVLLF